MVTYAPFMNLVNSKFMSLRLLVPLPELPPRSPKKKLGPKFKPTSHLTFSPNRNPCEYDLVSIVKLIKNSTTVLVTNLCRIGFIRNQIFLELGLLVQLKIRPVNGVIRIK